MNQTFALNDGPGQADVHFMVIVEMGKRLAAKAQGSEAIVPARHEAMLDTQVLESSDELTA